MLDTKEVPSKCLHNEKLFLGSHLHILTCFTEHLIFLPNTLIGRPLLLQGLTEKGKEIMTLIKVN